MRCNSWYIPPIAGCVWETKREAADLAASRFLSCQTSLRWHYPNQVSWVEGRTFLSACFTSSPLFDCRDQYKRFFREMQQKSADGFQKYSEYGRIRLEGGEIE